MAQNTTKAASFIAKLLHGVTAAHMLHLQAKGKGSFAKHKALGVLYDELSDQADALAEEYFGAYQLIESYPTETFTPASDALIFVQELYEFVLTNRNDMGAETHLQNSIDSILTLLSTSAYKLRYLE